MKKNVIDKLTDNQKPFGQKVSGLPKPFYYGALITLMIGLMLFITGCGTNKDEGNQAGKKAETVNEKATDHKEDGEHKQRYHCPMHPTYTSDKMGDCPICGMNLVPIPDANTSANVPPASGTPGLATITVPQETAKRLGLTIGTTETKHLTREIRTSARIAADESRQVRVTARIEGWVEKLFVNVTGQSVKKGAPLLTLYSPELVAAQQELLTAVTMVKEFKEGSYDALNRQGQTLLQAARQRLKLWQISDKQIAQIEKSGKIQNTLTLVSPASGFVSEKTVLQGQKIMAGESLMVITDLTHVWGFADIYEPDIPYIKIGTPIEITIPNQPGKEITGKIALLDPSLDPMTRTLKARIDIDNQSLSLKPEMYADARLKVDIGEKLVIPVSAVMRSGQRDYVFVVTKDQNLMPVEVKLGVRSGDYFEMVSGLYEGDKVVTSANFLVDSESSLRAALQAVTSQSQGETK